MGKSLVSGEPETEGIADIQNGDGHGRRTCDFPAPTTTKYHKRPFKITQIHYTIDAEVRVPSESWGTEVKTSTLLCAFWRRQGKSIPCPFQLPGAPLSVFIASCVASSCLLPPLLQSPSLTPLWPFSLPFKNNTHDYIRLTQIIRNFLILKSLT